MNEAIKAFDNLNTGIVVSSPDLIVTYVNQRCYEIFDILGIPGLKVGGDMAQCHKPETVEKLKVIYQEFADRKKNVHYYTAPSPVGLLTIVAVPYYEGEALGGVVEFIFESGLG
jgi:PAS domain-containing protein